MVSLRPTTKLMHSPIDTGGGIETVAERPAQRLLHAAPGSVANVHWSSATNEWETPQEFFDRMNAVHRFTLDPCCTHGNAKCRRHYTMSENGLAHSWQNERVWMNPPYGREIGIWMKKAFDESRGSAFVACLVPARTDTAWWHEYAAKGEVTFIRGRLKFGRSKNSAPFPSAIVIFKPQNDKGQA